MIARVIYYKMNKAKNKQIEIDQISHGLIHEIKSGMVKNFEDSSTGENSDFCEFEPKYGGGG